MDCWINEPAFRAEVRRDPEGTVRRSGAGLDEREWAALRKIDWSLSDEELHARMRKMKAGGRARLPRRRSGPRKNGLLGPRVTGVRRGD